MVQRFLRHLVEDTAAATRPLEREELQLALAAAGDVDVGSYRVFAEEKYGRNRVELQEHFELVVICWKPGQFSAIHDHGASLCGYLVLEGEMTEELYEPAGGTTASKATSRDFGPGQIAIAEGPRIHQIRNRSTRDLVTLHLYTPPMGENSRIYLAEGAAANTRRSPKLPQGC